MPILRRLKKFLDVNGVRYTVLSRSQAFTAEGVAAAQHVPPREFDKVVIVNAGERFRMLVLPGAHRGTRCG